MGILENSIHQSIEEINSVHTTSINYQLCKTMKLLSIASILAVVATMVPLACTATDEDDVTLEITFSLKDQTKKTIKDSCEWKGPSGEGYGAGQSNGECPTFYYIKLPENARPEVKMGNLHKNKTYTLAMLDLNAPDGKATTDTENLSPIMHWMVENMKSPTHFSPGNEDCQPVPPQPQEEHKFPPMKKCWERAQYIGPAPHEGLHYYAFVLFEHDPLHQLHVPGDENAAYGHMFFNDQTYPGQSKSTFDLIKEKANGSFVSHSLDTAKFSYIMGRCGFSISEYQRMRFPEGRIVKILGMQLCNDKEGKDPQHQCTPKQ